MLAQILDNIKQIRYRLRVAAQKAGRDPDKVGLVAVTKYAGVEQIRELLASGLVAEVGENRVQDAAAKKGALGAAAGKARWHLIGHLQTNKAKKALEVFDAVDALDSLKLAQALDKSLEDGGRIAPVLVQVKLSERETQSGVSPEELAGLLESLKALKRLDVQGLMAIAPNLEPVEAVRPHFRALRGLFDRFFTGRPSARLSMGMSRDFEVAVEEGATEVRIGSTIFT
jgi:pyridoxal phosphate enzyme (YggS family)